MKIDIICPKCKEKIKIDIKDDKAFDKVLETEEDKRRY